MLKAWLEGALIGLLPRSIETAKQGVEPYAYLADVLRRAVGHHGAVSKLRRTGGRYALCTMCIGVGQGIALIIERV